MQPLTSVFVLDFQTDRIVHRPLPTIFSRDTALRRIFLTFSPGGVLWDFRIESRRPMRGGSLASS